MLVFGEHRGLGCGTRFNWLEEQRPAGLRVGTHFGIMVQPWLLIHEAPDNPSPRIRLVLSGAGKVIWLQRFHKIYGRGAGFAASEPVSLGSFLFPIPLCVGTQGPVGVFLSLQAVLLPYSSPTPWVTPSWPLLLLPLSSSPNEKGFRQNASRPPSHLQVSHFLGLSDFPRRVSEAKPCFPFVLTIRYQASSYAWEPPPLYTTVYTVLPFDFSKNSTHASRLFFFFLQSTLFGHNEGTRIFAKWNYFMCHPLSLCV